MIRRRLLGVAGALVLTALAGAWAGSTPKAEAKVACASCACSACTCDAKSASTDACDCAECGSCCSARA